MYATICSYARVVGSVDDVVQASRGLAWLVGEAPGFVAYLMLDAGDGGLMSVSIFETQAELAGADRLVAEWVAEHLAGVLPDLPHVTTGEVILQRGM